MAEENEPTDEEKIAVLMSLSSGPYVLQGNGDVDCNFNHPVHGVIPFTASATDTAEHGRLLHRGIVEAVPPLI